MEWSHRPHVWQASGECVQRLLSTLEALYEEDASTMEGQLPALLRLAAEGSATASEASRRARKLAMTPKNRLRMRNGLTGCL